VSAVDAFVSAAILVAVGVLVAGWVLRQLVDEVLYRREVPLLRERWANRPRWTRRTRAVGADA
jgi:hypothetical protein